MPQVKHKTAVVLCPSSLWAVKWERPLVKL